MVPELLLLAFLPSNVIPFVVPVALIVAFGSLIIFPPLTTHTAVEPWAVSVAPVLLLKVPE